MSKNKHVITKKEHLTEYIFILYRVAIILLAIALFVPGINPANVSKLINENIALFTAGVDYGSLTDGIGRALNRGWVQESSFVILYISSMAVVLGVIGNAVCIGMTLGSLKFRILSNKLISIGSVLSLLGLGGIYLAYLQLAALPMTEKVGAHQPKGIVLITVSIIFILILSIVLLLLQPKPGAGAVYELEQKYKLFLLYSPFIALIFVFGYLQVWGLRFAFYDYKPGDTLSSENYVGFKWFTYLWQSDISKRDMRRVMTNTMAMSGLGLLFSWTSMAFAIFLCEIKDLRIRRLIQTLTTIPNFISWVMVYAFAFVLFSTDGFFSTLAVQHGGVATNYLMHGDHIWIKMLLWGMWKGMGWGAIVYIAGISGIDQQLYEAATVDGAGRFSRMWNITVPGLLPTFLVLFLMGISSILSNGLDQFFVFRNPNNAKTIEVLDLYLYRLGIVSGAIPLSTALGIMKTAIGIVLFVIANKFSKKIRGNSIM